MFTVIDKSILEATEDYICHQCNCVSKHSAGVAKAIFDIYPHANVYKGRVTPSQPGTLAVRRGILKRGVINMFAQYYPGGPVWGKYDGDYIKDDNVARLKYFRQCLFHMAHELPNYSFAFPWGIGCGLAEGDWGEYITILKNFERYVEGDVTIYKLPV